ncbi:unnamed protein product [Boreogadus saida]
MQSDGSDVGGYSPVFEGIPQRRAIKELAAIAGGHPTGSFQILEKGPGLLHSAVRSAATGSKAICCHIVCEMRRETCESREVFPVNIHIKTLADDMRDRLTSFRKAGLKKEKPLIQHSTDLQTTTTTEMPLPQPLFDDRSLNLSEKEINDLFEKMMEDMNLNEDRKAPLRRKDLSTKREMVVQYISATSKSITGSKVAIDEHSWISVIVLITVGEGWTHPQPPAAEGLLPLYSIDSVSWLTAAELCVVICRSCRGAY